MSRAYYQRRSIRLDSYDYSQPGVYFITLVTAERTERFGAIIEGEMRLSPVGQMVYREWYQLPERFSGLESTAFVLMPNHIHGVLSYCAKAPENQAASALQQTNISDVRLPQVARGSLGAILRAFKSSTSLRYHRMRESDAGPLWQRNYYEHIVRNPAELERIYAYIVNNPCQWALDSENPNR